MSGVSEGEEIVTLKLLMKKMEDFAKERDWEKYHSPRNLLLALVNIYLDVSLFICGFVLVFLIKCVCVMNIC